MVSFIKNDQDLKKIANAFSKKDVIQFALKSMEDHSTITKELATQDQLYQNHIEHKKIENELKYLKFELLKFTQKD